MPLSRCQDSSAPSREPAESVIGSAMTGTQHRGRRYIRCLDTLAQFGDSSAGAKARAGGADVAAYNPVATIR